MFSNEQDILKDPKFVEVKEVYGYHYFTDNSPRRENVETENIKATFDLTKHYKKPIGHIRAMHCPIKKSSALEKISGKEFQGVSTHLIVYEGMPLMLLANIAPQFGLFNGAITHFKGFLYLPDNLIVKLRACELRDLGIHKRIDQKTKEIRRAKLQSRLPLNDDLMSLEFEESR